MKTAAHVACAALLAVACAANRTGVTPPATAQVPAPAPVATPNFIVVESEAVERPEVDALSKVRIFVDGMEVGETEPGLASAPKRWAGRVPSGNRPVRFERWVMRRVSDWTLDLAVPERFLRFAQDRPNTVTLRFFDDGKRFELTREP